MDVQRLEVGPWPMNCYLIRWPESEEVAIVDPGADADRILEAVDGRHVGCILLTHGHPDHTGALEPVREATGALVGIHPADALAFGVDADFPLQDRTVVAVSGGRVTVSHLPGHTAGSVCFRLDGQAICGDAIFPGGPGHTATPEALAQSLASLGRTVFSWADDVALLPGHGPGTTVGAEREAFERFVTGDHPPGLCGDVSWS